MRTDCRACGGSDLRTILDLGLMPLAGGFLSNDESIQQEKLYPLQVHACARCGLVQILTPVDADVLFQDYSFSSSTIRPLVEHFESYAEWLRKRLAPSRVVEFGCNDGVLLTPLEKAGVRTIGVDISENITQMARAKGLEVITGFFNESMADHILSKFGRADVVTGSNAFPHNDKPGEILEAAKKVLSDDGHICLEVMYAGDLLQQLQWDTLYHEHLTFYSLGTLSLMLKKYGFHVRDAERLPMHGGSLRVCASVKPVALEQGAEQILRYEDEIGLNRIQTWERFSQESRRKIDIVTEVFRALSRQSTIWAYGAAGKATMWINACKLDYLGAVVDASPLRAGKLMPGTHTPIVTPEQFREHPPEHMFVTAWNYGELIRSKEKWFQGIWSVPLPDLRFY